jgi:hypothetical protein
VKIISELGKNGSNFFCGFFCEKKKLKTDGVRKMDEDFFQFLFLAKKKSTQ